MFQFLNDYSECAHPHILEALLATQLHQYKGYGYDQVSEKVRNTIKSKINNDQAAVHFGITGTQANLVCIAAMLSPIDGIIACDSGHIVTNEAGAIEATGHKIFLAPANEGKLTVDVIDALRKRHQFKPHVVRTKAVYISNSTELGTVYSLNELQKLSEYCHQHDMYLFLDGARLGSALAYTLNNPLEQTVSLSDIAELTDMFWLGGTKMGAMFGEIIIIPNQSLATDFNIHLKQHGGLMAKGFLLALQFEVLLKDDMYLSLCHHANSMALKLANGIEAYNYDLFMPTQTNQVFAILPNHVITKLKETFDFYEWQAIDHNSSIVRLVTSWATPEHQVDRFMEALIEVS